MPIPLQKLFTYKITAAESQFLKTGMRVAVPFGKSKIITGLVYNIHSEEPIAYVAKDIHQILDDKPVITANELKNWEWISNYYMCTLGEVLRASLPSALLLESETLILKNEAFDQGDSLSHDEYLVYEALQLQSELNVAEISKILDKKNVLPIVHSLIKKEVVLVHEKIFEKYRPKLIKYVRLSEKYKEEPDLHELLDSLNRATKQREAVMNYFMLTSNTQKPVSVKSLKEKSETSSAVIKSLVDKGVFEIYYLQQDRISFSGSEKLKELSDIQTKALGEIKRSFHKNDVTLLHGITSSGKTEIYTHLIKEVIDSGRQVLYLLPEIALTTQIISRLKLFFGNNISVYHSKYTVNERVEVWNNLLDRKEKTQIILGARSSVLLPFHDLGLIIVDEEHETSYKQFDPAPRYNARDTAIVLAKENNAKIILGSATPSLESFHNVQTNKYGYVKLERRFGNVLLPEIELVDIKEKHRKKRMTGHFSDRLIDLIQERLRDNEQVILFQNRRGYSPIVECTTCGIAPQCPNCDVSLTYHKFKSELRCHYCGFNRDMPELCPACNNPSLNTKGFGTEQIEMELGELFPQAKISRMDLDTTRGKYGYHKIISKFESQDIDILVGTQMLSKGLDFKNVSLVGILNADNMLNFPDFRAHERSFQLMVQVSGRSGRDKKRGRVVIQTFNPHHQILQQVTTNDYKNMYKEQMEERRQFIYPPLVRILKITLKHKDFQKVNNAAEWFGLSLKNNFHSHVLGPTSPAIARIRNQHIKTILVKFPAEQSLTKSKAIIQNIKNSFLTIGDYRSVRVNLDVDNY